MYEWKRLSLDVKVSFFRTATILHHSQSLHLHAYECTIQLNNTWDVLANESKMMCGLQSRYLPGYEIGIVHTQLDTGKYVTNIILEYSTR